MSGSSQDLLAIQQLRSIIGDEIPRRPEAAIVDSVGLNSIAVRLRSGSTLLRDIKVMGGLEGLEAGQTIYLLPLNDGSLVALNSRGGGGVLSAATATTTFEGVVAHDHSSLYFDKGATLDLLSLKADIGHTHNPAVIQAESGVIGGWTIDVTAISKPNARLDSRGYISFGTTPPTAYGNNIGAWLGYSANLARMSLYSDASNYLQWDGTKLLIRAQNFQLDGSGNIAATGGTVGGWTMTSTLLSATGIQLDASAQRITVGAVVPSIIIDGVNKNIRSSDYVSGNRGFQIDAVNARAEFNNVVIRGELHASVFTMDEIHAAGGSVIILETGVLMEPATTV